jgi:hypothetical protein
MSIHLVTGNHKQNFCATGRSYSIKVPANLLKCLLKEYDHVISYQHEREVAGCTKRIER